MANTAELEEMVAARQDGTSIMGTKCQAEEERFEELWQKQQRLWSRSRRLYDENLGHGFTRS